MHPPPHELLAVLERIRPIACTQGKVRIGTHGDGGYVLPDDLHGIAQALSIGIGHDASFDLELAQRGIPVIQYDPDVNGPPQAHPYFSFNKLAWAPRDHHQGLSLDSMIERHGFAHHDRGLLKFDVEGVEWACLNAASQASLLPFRIIVCELLGLDKIGQPNLIPKMDSILRKLTHNHTVVHLHGNNVEDFADIQGFLIPPTIEITLLRNDRSAFTPAPILIPGSFDHPNHPNRPDLAFCSWPITLMNTPESVQAYFQAGRDLRKQGNNSAAIAHFRAALALQPEHLPSLNNLANALQAMGDTNAALALLQQAVEIAPGKAVLHCNLGSLWQLLQQPQAARAAFEQAIALQPELALAHHNLAKLALAEGWMGIAEQAFQRALLLQPGNAELHLDYGDACQRFGAPQRAVEHYRLAARLAPSARAYNCLGIALQALGKLDLARTSYLRALKLDPESNSTPINLAQLHERQGDLDAARALYETLLARHPDDTRSHLQLAALYRKQADWPSAAAHHPALCRALGNYLQQDDPEPLPLLHAMAMPLPAQQIRPLAERIAAQFKKQAAALDIQFAPPTDPAPQRLRIGYLSPDFRDHAVGSVILGLFQHHQREAFETFAYSLLTPPNDPWTEQLRGDFDHFHDVSLATPVELARRIHADGIHILVDLAGYTTECRPLVLALKPAPVQIQYLGYPGSMGADFVPWVVADALLIPPEHEDQYRETVLRLPHGWGAVRPAVPETTRSRSDYGLPVDAMVYCCLNATYKIEPVVFALWMEILRQVPGSVLWLTDGGRSGSNERLRQQARAAGIAPERLVFAGRLPHDEYLARYRLADLFLDTFSYNAGSTALATFAAGLPMLTYPGEHYPRRMGASLCQAAGMPELICTSHDEYLHRAIELGQHPERLAALKRTLAERIESAPLFQPERFIAGLEALYRQLWQQWCEANPATAESLV